MLFEFISFFVGEHEYPTGFGLNLLRLVQSVPPTMLRLKVKSPLIPVPLFLKVCQYARDKDYEDVQLLFRAVFGDKDRTLGSFPEELKKGPEAPGKIRSATLHIITAELSTTNLTQKIGDPIDAARLSFNLSPVTVSDSAEFIDIITSFYSHILRRTQRLIGSCQPEDIQKEALALLEQAFSRDGGINGATFRGHVWYPRRSSDSCWIQ